MQQEREMPGDFYAQEIAAMVVGFFRFLGKPGARIFPRVGRKRCDSPRFDYCGFSFCRRYAMFAAMASDVVTNGRHPRVCSYELSNLLPPHAEAAL